MSDRPLLTFPTDYPIKVVGRTSGTLRVRVDAIVLRHAPDLDLGRVGERYSANGNFLSISYVIRAVSREQVEALARELTGCEDVLLVI